MAEPPTEEIVPSVGEASFDWCPNCNTTGLATADIYAITSQGSQVIGRYAICATCAWTPYQHDTAKLDQLRVRLAAAEQEVSRLRAGESDDPAAENTWPTPAQWIRRWNDATPDERLARAEQILKDANAAQRCQMSFHDDAVAENEHLRRVHVKARALAESWRAAGMRRADHDHDGVWVGLAHACAQIIAALDGGTVEDADGNPIGDRHG